MEPLTPKELIYILMIGAAILWLITLLFIIVCFAVKRYLEKRATILTGPLISDMDMDILRNDDYDYI